MTGSYATLNRRPLEATDDSGQDQDRHLSTRVVVELGEQSGSTVLSCEASISSTTLQKKNESRKPIWKSRLHFPWYLGTFSFPIPPGNQSLSTARKMRLWWPICKCFTETETTQNNRCHNKPLHVVLPSFFSMKSGVPNAITSNSRKIRLLSIPGGEAAERSWAWWCGTIWLSTLLSLGRRKPSRTIKLKFALYQNSTTKFWKDNNICLSITASVHKWSPSAYVFCYF